MWRTFQPDEAIAEQYKVERVLRGGMGVVYIAVDQASGKRFALKTIRGELIHEPGESDHMSRFQRESVAWIGLDYHPHIVQAHAVIRDGHQPFLLLEYIDGPSLAAVLRHAGPLAVKQAVRWATDICNGMLRIHAKQSGCEQNGLIHRDLKPSNVLITRKGIAKITDFGLVKLSDDRQLTHTRQFLGTLSYSSPEQLRGARSIDHRSDIFSFGSVLYEMLTGRRPFTGGSPAAVSDAIQHGDPDWSLVPPPLRPTVASCMQKSPGQRIPTFQAVLDSLDLLDPGGYSRDDSFTCSRCGFECGAPMQCPVCEMTVGSFHLGATVIREPAEGASQSDRGASRPAAGVCRCGTPLKPDNRFCQKCGTPAPSVQCNCGSWNLAANAYCNSCGRNLTIQK